MNIVTIKALGSRKGITMEVVRSLMFSAGMMTIVLVMMLLVAATIIAFLESKQLFAKEKDTMEDELAIALDELIKENMLPEAKRILVFVKPTFSRYDEFMEIVESLMKHGRRKPCA